MGHKRRAWWIWGGLAAGGILTWVVLRFGLLAWLGDDKHPWRPFVEALSWLAGIGGLAVGVAALVVAVRQGRSPRVGPGSAALAAEERALAAGGGAANVVAGGASVQGSVGQARSVSGSMLFGDRNIVADQARVVEAGAVTVEAGGQVVLPSVDRVSEPLPPPEVGLCVGRDEFVARVRDEWLAGELVAVLGGPGIGKSTVLGRALADEQIVSKFEDRRFVVSCEGASSAEAVVDKLAGVLGIVHSGPGLRNQVVGFLRERPCVLVLDNFESVADADLDGAATFVRELQSTPGVVQIGLGYRGGAPPPGISRAVDIRLGPLSREAAVEVFVSAAGGQHRDDPDLDSLIDVLDGVPLAIVLLASLARSSPRLSTTRAAWQAKRSDLLQHGFRPDRLSSLPVSIELSWDRLSPDARCALSLAALLPDGWPFDSFVTYLPDTFAPGVVELSSRALLHDDDRQRCLAPIREYVRTHHEPPAENYNQLVSKVHALAARGNLLGTVEGDSVLVELVPEFTNIVEVLHNAIPVDPELGAVVPGVLTLQRFTGLGDDQLAQLAVARADSITTRAAITFALAQLYHSRSDQRSRALFNRALPLYQQVGAVLGQANCLRNLGRVEFLESNNDEARALFNQALPLYQQVGAVLGQANCLSNLGEVEFRESNNDEARALFNQALPLYQRIRDRYSQAITHAFLAGTTTGREREDHRFELEQLLDDLKLGESTRAVLRELIDGDSL